jgi:hypothetical protein
MKAIPNMTRNSLYCFLFLGLFPGILAAQESDATYEQVVHEYTFQADGSVDYHHFSQLKLHTHYAFHRAFGETFLLYNPDLERISVREAYTLMKYGTKVPLPANAINEVLPRMADNAPPYHRLREMVISHTGLERGATIVLDYVRQQLSPSRPFLSGWEVLATDAPVEKMTLVIRHPEAMRLFHRLFHTDLSPEIVRENGMISYRWELSKVPAYLPGPYTSAEMSSLPVICWSNAASLEEGWKSFASLPVFHQKAAPDLQIILDTLLTPGSDAMEKTLTVWNHVLTSTQVWSPSLPILPNGPRSATECWNSSGGTPLEVAVLAGTMMRAVGLDATVILTIPARQMLPDLAIQDLWTHPMLRVRLSEGELFLDPHKNPAYSAEAAIADHFLLPVLPGGEWQALQVEGKTAEAKYRFAVQLNARGLMNGKVEADLRNGALPIRDLHSGDFPKRFQIVSKELNGQYLPDESRIGMNEARLAFSLQSADSLPLFGDHRRLLLPYPPNAPDALLQRNWPENMKSDIQLPYPLKVEMEWEISVPKGYRLLVQGRAQDVQNDAGTLTFSVREKGGKWIIRRSLESPSRVPENHYRDFRTLITTWQALGAQPVWLVPETE